MQNTHCTTPSHTKIQDGVESLYPIRIFQNTRITYVYCFFEAYFQRKDKIPSTWCLSKNSMPVVNNFFCCYFSYHCHFNKWKQIPITSNEMASFLCAQNPVKENKSHIRECFHVSFFSFFPTIFLFHLMFTYILFIQSKPSYSVSCFC